MWQNVIKTIAPTVATALLGPLGGAAVAAIGSALGVSDATQDKIKAAIEQGQLTGEQVAKLKELELQFQSEEKERGFKYAELAFKDRDSARTNNTAGGIQARLFVMSVVLLVATLGCEAVVLFVGYPKEIPDVLVGRILGLMDSVALMVLAYYYGTSAGSAQKTEIMAGQGKQ